MTGVQTCALPISGLDVVLVVLEPQDFENKQRLEQYERFLKLLATHPDWPRAAFWISGDEAALRRKTAEHIVKWLIIQDAAHEEVLYRFKGRPLVVLSPEMRRWTSPHPGLIFRYTSPYRSQWIWSEPHTNPVKLSPDRKQSLVYAGWRGNSEATASATDEWQLPREDGRTLKHGLRQAIPLWTNIICIESWNDYRNGSFVEPNALDGSKPYNILRDELEHLRRVTSQETR